MRIKNIFKRKATPKPSPTPSSPAASPAAGFFSTHAEYSPSVTNKKLRDAWAKTFDKALEPVRNCAVQEGFAMDSVSSSSTSLGTNTSLVSNDLLCWYTAQTFIGFNVAAIMAQNWLVSKACLMPAKDATRNGFEIIADHEDAHLTDEVLKAVRELDVAYKLNKNLIEFVQMGRVFGIRVAMFVVESDDPDYYTKPFNIDGVTPKSYKGISQIDPYWMSPQLDVEASSNPAAIGFYEPTWWSYANPTTGVNTKVHKSHLIIFKTEEVADVLKPTYRYGGIPVPQKIYERVYAAERVANEAPMLALTKRTRVLKTNIDQALADQVSFDAVMENASAGWNNYGQFNIGREDELQQFDTSLDALDAVIMTQYQLVAAAANVPATKLLGTSPKGFNATGEFEEASYHEELQSIQTHDLTALIKRHHLLLMHSEIAPEMGIEPIELSIEWNALDAMTAKEEAELNRNKAETGAILMQSGAIDSADERQRVVNDPASGYTGMVDEEPYEGILSDPEGA